MSVKCKICEEEVDSEKLGDHSDKCKEVHELKLQISIVRAKILRMKDKAFTMHNNITQIAAKHQTQYKKSLSRSNSEEVTPTQPQAKPTKSLFSYNKSNSNCVIDFGGSPENGSGNPNPSEQKISKQKPFIVDHGEYHKIIDESQKSIFALKKIIVYGEKLEAAIYDNYQIQAIDLEVKNEIEGLYKEVVDENVSKFLRDFLEELEEYKTLKVEYGKKYEELQALGPQVDYKGAKEKFKQKVALSFNKRKSATLGSLPLMNKEENKEEKTLPGFKNSPSNQNGSIEVNKKNPFERLLANGTGNNSPKDMKNSILLAPNNNHMISGHHSPHKEEININTLKEKLLNTQQVIDSAITNGTIQKPQTDLQKLKQESGTASPHPEAKNSPSNNIHTQIKLGRKSSIGDSRELQELTKPEETSESNNKKDDDKSENAKKRRKYNSLDFLKSLHAQETNQKNYFPSLDNLDSPKEETEQPEETKNQKKKKLKKNKTNDIWTDPDFRGSFSDCGPRPRSRRDSFDENVTIDDFEFIKMIGKGAYGKVWLVRKKGMGDLYAMKIIQCTDAKHKLESIKREQEILKVLKGDFVVKAIWAFPYENYICFVLEYMIGGDFAGILEEVGRVDTVVGRFYFAELVLALESLHNLNIVHRDLKPENILLDANGHIKLTDFGLSEGRHESPPITSKKVPEDENAEERMKVFGKFINRNARDKKRGFRVKNNSGSIEREKIFVFDDDDKKGFDPEKNPASARPKKSPGQTLSFEKRPRICGTPDYMAPEIILGEASNSKTLDWWSMGVILFEFLVGYPPFNADSIEGVFEKITDGIIEWPNLGYGEEDLDPLAADLIEGLLELDPNYRLGANGAQEIKNHPFFEGIKWETLRDEDAPIIPFVKDEYDTHNFEKRWQYQPLEEEEMLHPFPQDGHRRAKSNSLNLGGFQMRRLDILHDYNQKVYKKLQKQKSLKAE